MLSVIGCCSTVVVKIFKEPLNKFAQTSEFVQRFPKCEICFTYFEGLSGPCPTSASMNYPSSPVAVGTGISLVCFPMEAMGLKYTGTCTAECPL